MRQAIWSLIARFLVRHPRLIELIMRSALRTPYEHIHGPDGSLYMSRWWLIRERRWLPFAVRLHHIWRPDLERSMHDHPADFRTLILRGWYVEHDLAGISELRCVGTTYARRAQEFHRITQVPAEGVVTVFIYGRHRNAWGFLVNGRKVHWSKYVPPGRVAARKEQA